MSKNRTTTTPSTSIASKAALDALAAQRSAAARKAVATRQARIAAAAAGTPGVTTKAIASAAAQKAVATRKARAAALAAEAEKVTRIPTYEELEAERLARLAKDAKNRAEHDAAVAAAAARIARLNEWKALTARAREVGYKVSFSAITDNNLIGFREGVEQAEADAAVVKSTPLAKGA